MDGYNYKIGRVEIWHNDTWSTICDNPWGREETGVVCRNLGIFGGGQQLISSLFGQGTTDTQLDQVMCNGSELSLLDCSYNGFGRNICNDHASVRCGIGMLCTLSNTCTCIYI